MKLRHATALALVGWYLIIPPDSPVPHSVDSAAPISHWSIIANFESGDTCEQALTELRNKNGDPAKLSAERRLRRFQKRQVADPELGRARVDHAVCTTADNPRLGK